MKTRSQPSPRVGMTSKSVADVYVHAVAPRRRVEEFADVVDEFVVNLDCVKFGVVGHAFGEAECRVARESA